MDYATGLCLSSDHIQRWKELSDAKHEKEQQKAELAPRKQEQMLIQFNQATVMFQEMTQKCSDKHSTTEDIRKVISTFKLEKLKPVHKYIIRNATTGRSSVGQNNSIAPKKKDELVNLISNKFCEMHSTAEAIGNGIGNVITKTLFVEEESLNDYSTMNAEAEYEEDSDEEDDDDI